MDMRFHWLKDRECQQQFKFYWQPDKLNHADYWTKHHSAAHHVNYQKRIFNSIHSHRNATNEKGIYQPGHNTCSIELDTTGSSHEGVMILPVHTVSTLPYRLM